MDLVRKISSWNFFIFNLVLIGVIFGFSLAFLSFSCSTPRNGNVAYAQVPPPPIPVPQDALAVAEDLQNAFYAVSEKVLPSVVEVKTVTIQRRSSQGNNQIPWEFFFGPRNNQEDQSPEREYRSQGMGSGFIVRYDRGTYYVLTNNHVVEDATEIVVATLGGREYPAEVVGTDSRRDLAVISFKTQDSFSMAELGNSDGVKVGHWAIAMGNPLGEQFAFSVTMGIVSAVGRMGGPGGNINDFIQTDASINQGNSGGPLVNVRGEVIGINTWIASNNSGASVGLGFAIPINNAIRSMDEIIRTGSVSDGWLGVSLIDPTRDILTALGIANARGAMASQVFLGSPADKAGIRPGDIITHIDNREIRESSQLTLAVGNIKPGDQAVLTVIRDGVTRNYTVRIETRTDAVAADHRKLWPGVVVMPLTDELRSSLRLANNAQGVYVSQVMDETPANIIGMQRGDRIIAINDTTVNDLASFYRVLNEKTDRELWFTLIRGENTLESMKFRR